MLELRRVSPVHEGLQEQREVVPSMRDPGCGYIGF